MFKAVSKNVYVINVTRNFKRMSSSCNNAIPTLYYDERSPPCRLASMTAKYLNVQINIEEVDLFERQHRSEEYKTINPLRKVPSLKHGDIIINDSHAIAIYLCEKFGNDSKIYPKDPSTRALINCMLFYDDGILFPIDSTIMSDYFRGIKDTDPKLIKALRKQLTYLDQYMKNKKWVVGDNFTVADMCLAGTLTTVDLLNPIKDNEFSSVFRWLMACKNESVFDINEKGLNAMKKEIDDFRNTT